MNEAMTVLEIIISVCGMLMGILGTISTIFLNRLLKSLDTMGNDVSGIKIEIGKIVTTQNAHGDKFDDTDRRIEKMENKIFP